MNAQLISQDEARTQGLKRYFTGKPCAHGHISERTVSWGGCVTCIAINDERARAQRQQARQANQRAGRPIGARTGASRRVQVAGFDKDPLPWPDDGGVKRVPIYDHNDPEPRLARRVGWVNCLGRVRTHRFFSYDVVNERVCERCRGKEPHPIFDHLGQ